MYKEDIRNVPGLTSADSVELLKLSRIARRLPSWLQSVRAAKGGQYLSLVRGRGMEYDESRLYQPGDDIRYLDSRATARRGEAFTKIFREERERPVFVCIDDRASMHFATQGRFKRTIASNAAAIIAWKSYYQGERIGALVFDEKNHNLVKSGRGRRSVMKVLRHLSRPARRASLSESDLSGSMLFGLDMLRRHLTPGSLIFFFSDFYGLDKSNVAEFSRLRGHSDVVLAHIYDPLEQTLPEKTGEYRMANDLSELTLSGAEKTIQERYDELIHARKEKILSLARTLSSPILNLATICDPASEIRKLFRY